MKILQAYNEKIRQVAKYQSYDVGESYRESPYLIKETLNGKTAVFNCFTREILLFTEQEFKTSFNPKSRAFVERWYFLPEHWDARTWHESFAQEYRWTNKKREFAGISNYVILPTLGCNADCTYCFQCGEKKKVMTEETADAVAQYIWKTFAGQVKLKWFGGEPLINAPIITRICTTLQGLGLNYGSLIVTNGLLVNQIDMDTLKNLWRVNTVQITLDGTEQYSDSVKRWKNPTGYEFDRVLHNISYLIANDIRVNIRLNVSKDNETELLELIDILKERFGGTGRIYCSPHILFEGVGEEPEEYTEEDCAELYRICKAVQEKLVAAGLSRYDSGAAVRQSNCMADNLSSICISPAGSVTVCEHYTDDTEQVIGTVFNDKIDLSIVHNWQAQLRCDKCSNCVIRPLCTKIKLCPVGKCTEAERDYTEWQIRQTLRGGILNG